MEKRISFLATGSEIITGEITNTNGQIMCQALFQHGANIGEHMVCDDQMPNLMNAITHLKSRSNVVIITGGLGPTSDDRTRHALAEVLGLELIFSEKSWQKIGERAQARGFKLTPNNQQQAYFPEGATILTNHNGSADACCVEHEGQSFFLLPGPPTECLPLFEEHILDYLRDRDYFTDTRQYKWHIRGIGESQIAFELEPIAEKYQIEIAYRCSKPDLYIKLHLTHSHPVDTIISEFDALLDQYCIQKDFPA